MATPSNTPPTTPITVGTAGHIDHGKTRLVERLTGMRADRPYERERGMTIDIGYAEMTTAEGRRVGFVDLPGHERFIRNMVAGATGIDLALLVVAADDGVMPQTREHMEILDLLGIRRGVVVLNKVDLVDEEMRELAMEELHEFLEGTGLKDAPVVACSAETGEGVEAVRNALLAGIADVEATDDLGCFFLGIQRTFAAQGFGCIVTGVPSAGRVALGDELELLPGAKRVRVRGIQVYHETTEHARAGHRTALNLSGVSHTEAARGMAVAAPGAYVPSRHIAVELKMLDSARRPLRHAAGARLLTGTLEEMVKVYLLEGDALAPGQTALIELRTTAPVATRDGAPFILRSDNAKETIGGGRVVASRAKPIGRRNRHAHDRLARWAVALDDPVERLRAALAFRGAAGVAELARYCQLTRKSSTALLDALIADGELVILPGGAFAFERAVSEGADRLRSALAGMHEAQPLLGALPIAEVRDRAELDEATLAVVLKRLGGEIVVEGRTIRLATHEVRIDPALKDAADQLLDCLRRAGFKPPFRDGLADAAALTVGDLTKALTFLKDQRTVREVAAGLLYGTEQLDEGLRLLRAVARKRGCFEPVDAKAALGGISRKWLIPLLEYYDRLGATRRDGNERRLTPKGEQMAENGIGGA